MLLYTEHNTVSVTTCYKYSKQFISQETQSSCGCHFHISYLIKIKKNLKKCTFQSRNIRENIMALLLFLSQTCVHMMLILLVISGKVGCLNYSMTSMKKQSYAATFITRDIHICIYNCNTDLLLLITRDIHIDITVTQTLLTYLLHGAEPLLKS